jgi:hypothetical protein
MPQGLMMMMIIDDSAHYAGDPSYGYIFQEMFHSILMLLIVKLT